MRNESQVSARGWVSNRGVSWFGFLLRPFSGTSDGDLPAVSLCGLFCVHAGVLCMFKFLLFQGLEFWKPRVLLFWLPLQTDNSPRQLCLWVPSHWSFPVCSFRFSDFCVPAPSLRVNSLNCTYLNPRTLLSSGPSLPSVLKPSALPSISPEPLFLFRLIGVG